MPVSKVIMMQKTLSLSILIMRTEAYLNQVIMTIKKEWQCLIANKVCVNFMALTSFAETEDLLAFSYCLATES